MTESEKALIHHEVPTEFQDEDIIYVVYRKKATPVNNFLTQEVKIYGRSWFSNGLASSFISFKKHRIKE